MHGIATLIVVALLASAGVVPGQERAKVGILPFDVVAVEGAAAQAGRGLARALRIEMVREKQTTPVLLDVPSGQKLPVETDEAAKIGEAAGVDLVIVGTVLDATTSHSSTGASTGGVIPGVGIGGRVRRTKTEILLHVQLVNAASGAVVHEFEAEGSDTDVGVGADVWGSIGSVNTDDNAWLNTPMGKAIRKAAQKIARETARHAKKSRS